MFHESTHPNPHRLSPGRRSLHRCAAALAAFLSASVEDVALALLRAAVSAPRGVTIFNVGDDVPATRRAFIEYFGKLLGTRHAAFLPLPLAYGYLMGTELRTSITGAPPVLTRHVLRLLTTPKVMSSQRIRQTLGFTPRFAEFHTGLEAALNGLSHHA